MGDAPAFTLYFEERALLRYLQLSEADEDGTRYPSEKIRAVPAHLRKVYREQLADNLLVLGAAGMLIVLDWDLLTVELTDAGVNYED